MLSQAYYLNITSGIQEKECHPLITLFLLQSRIFNLIFGTPLTVRKSNISRPFLFIFPLLQATGVTALKDFAGKQFKGQKIIHSLRVF